jgi:DNA polymerase-1
VLQIHDELIFEVKDGFMDILQKIVQEEMEGVFEKSFIHYKNEVPITVNASVGKTWQDL